MNGLDHVSLGVRDLARAAAFYDAALAPLGLTRLWSGAHGVEYGPPGGEGFLALSEAGSRARPPGRGFHLALAARNRRAVARFHAAALAAGGEDEGAPGPRPRYGPGYHAAFVRDLDGHRLEAVFHARVAARRPRP